MANLFKEKPIVKIVMLKGQDGEEKLINQADGSGLSFWIGTKAEFDAIPEAELKSDCVYYITDDTRDDFNTRLNELDTKVDNNTTDIAENTSDIATNTSNIESLLNVTQLHTDAINANTEAIANLANNKVDQAVENINIDTHTVQFAVAGVLTSNKNRLVCTIPIPKYPYYGYDFEVVNANITNAVVRQNGNYIVGNASQSANMGDISKATRVGNAVIVEWEDNPNTPLIDVTNATNNDVVFISGRLNYFWSPQEV